MVIGAGQAVLCQGGRPGVRRLGVVETAARSGRFQKMITWAKWSTLRLSPAHCWALRGPTLVSFANWKLTSGGWSISAQCRTPLMGNLFWSTPSPPPPLCYPRLCAKCSQSEALSTLPCLLPSFPSQGSDQHHDPILLLPRFILHKCSPHPQTLVFLKWQS